MQVFEDQEQGLRLALAQQQVLGRFLDPPPALGRIEGLPLRVLHRHVQEREQGRQGGLERPVQGEQPGGHLLADGPGIVLVFDAEVGPEKIDDGEVRGTASVGNAPALQDQPALGPVGARELPEQAGLADAGLSNGGDDLAMTSLGPVQGPLKLIKLSAPLHEVGEAPGCGRLKAGSGRVDADQLERLHGLSEALDRDRTQGLDPDERRGLAEGFGGKEHRARLCHLLHPGRQVGLLPHRGVVHAEVAAYGRHDDLARIQADPDLKGDALGAPDLLRRSV